MQGRRRYFENDENDDFVSVLPGDYWYRHSTQSWACRCPNGDFGALRLHQVTEHEDGTITVSPSILISDQNGPRWHGYLEQGIWREV